MNESEQQAPKKVLPMAGEVFSIEGHTAFLILPTARTEGTPMPWVWYAPTLPRLPGPEERWMFEQFLANGMAIAGVDVGESYGSPAGRAVFSALYTELVTSRGLAPRACLLARSRGGLMLYNWAVEHPEAVAGVAGIYPVCNLSSYPGLAKACGAYGLTEAELEATLAAHNPIDRLAPLAKAHVPIFQIHGDRDVTVPLEQNSAELAARYTALGGSMRLEVVKGGGHDMSPHWFRSQALVDFVLACAKAGPPLAGSADALDGATGKLFRADPAQRSFELLTETAFDPKTLEGRSRHKVYWNDQTRVTKVVRQNSFEGVEGRCLAHFRALDEANAAAAAEGRDVVVMHVTLLAAGEDEAGLAADDRNFVAPFTPDPASSKHRGGTIERHGKPMGVQLRGPMAEVDIRSTVGVETISQGFWETTIHGAREEGRFVVKAMDIYPRVDPRTVDDPKLPRILVVGDSISMNYHAAAKEALEGVANYHRIDGNGGPSDRGVVCMELWLGDYTQEGLGWDVIQFNHGLHDLKQSYDEATGAYGTHQVPVEAYKENLEREIQIMRKTGATLVWCTTTPVPMSSFGHWPNGTFGRQKDEEAVYNRAALEVMARHPEIRINDLNRFIRESAAFDTWRLQKDVHFWDGALQQVVGAAVAEGLKQVL